MKYSKNDINIIEFCSKLTKLSKQYKVGIVPARSGIALKHGKFDYAWTKEHDDIKLITLRGM